MNPPPPADDPLVRRLAGLDVDRLTPLDALTLLAELQKDAKSRGLTPSHFSFNVPGGRCEACQGEGEVRVEMQFLADVFVPCEQCDGRRFKTQVLEVKYRGKSITQVLDLTVREATAFFGGTPPSTVFAGKAQISATTQRGHSGLRALHT